MKNTTNQFYLINIYRTLYPQTVNTFFQVHIKYSSRETILWAIKQISENIKKKPKNLTEYFAS